MEIFKCEAVCLMVLEDGLWGFLCLWDPVCSVEFQILKANLNALVVVVALEETVLLIYYYVHWFETAYLYLSYIYAHLYYIYFYHQMRVFEWEL